MSYRFMRIIVFFDLPTFTYSDRRAYRDFRKYLLKSGFIMMQESVYSKLALNMTVANFISKGVKDNKPTSGLLQVLIVTERQFSRMELLLGEVQTEIIDSDERLVIL